MASATGIEVCSHSCLLAGIRPRAGGDAEIFAVRSLEGPGWPDRDEGIVESLRDVRQDARLPRRAVVVAWQFNDSPLGGPGLDVLHSIEAAGFHVASVLTPPEALLRLAVTRRRTSSDTPVAWLALNKCGASIAIVRNRDLLFSRSFPWTYRDDLKAGRAQALQRYSLVAHLAPEITHGIEIVRAEHGLPVDSIVTCGDLPDLRSFTMPLIEELDLEVETLDSTEGLRFVGAAASVGLAETAPAIWLTTAAALVSTEQSPRASTLFVGAAVAAIALLLLAGPYVYFSGRAPRSSASRDTVHDSTPQPIATQGRREPNRATSPQPGQPAGGSQQSESSSADKRSAIAAPVEPPAPLKDPLPRIDTVLIDQDRRLALVDGGVVAIGDAIGSRVVVGIERDAVVLREPSGRTVKVRVRSGVKS
jgi:hypothetical protein